MQLLLILVFGLFLLYPRYYLAMTLPSCMKCIVYGREKPLLQTRPIPRPRRGHVLVRVEAAGLNPVDAKDIIGDKLPHSWTYTRSWIRSSISGKVPGFDFAGTCVVNDEVGAPTPGNDQFSDGAKVFGTMPPFQGTLAEYISVPLDQICSMPETLKFEEAAALPLVGLTALQALSPHVSPESSVLVIGGSGGTGHVALQVARCLGSSRVSTICSEKNADFCRSCGASDIIDYTKPADTMLEELVKSPNHPFHVVMDCVSSADPRDQKTNYPKLIQGEAVAPHILTEDYIYRRLGGPSSDWIRAGLERTMGLQLWPNRHEKLFWIRFPKSSDELHQLKEWCEAGTLRPQIAKVYDFTEEGVQEAFDAILGRRVQGKVVVKIRSESATDE